MATDDRDRSRDDQQAPPQREGAPDDELRFEGPISFDEDYDDDDDGPAGGRTFLLTAVIAAAVIIVVAIALLLRSGSGPDEEELEQIAGESETAPAETEAAAGDPELRFRSVPTDAPGEEAAIAADATAEGEPVPTETVRTTEPSAGAEPDAPSTPSQTAETGAPSRAREAAPAEPMLEDPGDVDPGRVGDLARSGRISQAARLGRRLAASGNPSRWTLQVLFACDPGNVERAFENVRDARLTVVPASHQGRSCYRLCWGTYTSAADADEGSPEVPPYFRAGGAKPFPMRWGNALQ